MSDEDERERQWHEHFDRAVADGRCPYSGEPLFECHAADMCDCFDFPHIAGTVRELEARRAVEPQHREPGVWWYQAPKPRRWHRCSAWTRGQIDGDLVERCACGAIRSPRYGRHWLGRNSR